MQTTLNIDDELLDDELLKEAQELTGISGKTELLNASLKALVERESARRLAKLGGSEPQLRPISRRRFEL